MMDRPPHKQASRGESSASPRSRLLALLFVIIVSTCGSRSGLPLAAATSIACHPHGSVHTKRHQSPALTMTMSTFPRGGGIEGGASPSTPSSSSAKVKASTTPPPSPSAEIIAICRLVRRPFESFVNAVIDAKSHLVAAACGRALSIFGMYPVDTIKTRMQMGKPFVFDGLYRGVGGSLVGQVPYGVLTFGSYEMYKRYFLERFPNARPTLVYALSAILGDVTGSGWLCPSEVVKQQLQAGIYGNTMEAISGIWRGGGFGGFYRGYTGGLARDVPFRVAQLTTFEVTKNVYLRAKKRRLRMSSSSSSSSAAAASSIDDDVSLSALEAAACGAVAGSFSAAITNPLDRIKTLMMTDVTNAYGGSVATCASRMIRDDGLAGLFAGVVPRVAYIAPSVCIFFATYEFVQQKMRGGASTS